MNDHQEMLPIPESRLSLRPSRQRWSVKRGLDIVVSLSALVILSPVLVIVALAIRRRLGSPAR